MALFSLKETITSFSIATQSSSILLLCNEELMSHLLLAQGGWKAHGLSEDGCPREPEVSVTT